MTVGGMYIPYGRDIEECGRIDRHDGGAADAHPGALEDNPAGAQAPDPAGAPGAQRAVIAPVASVAPAYRIGGRDPHDRVRHASREWRRRVAVYDAPGELDDPIAGLEWVDDLEVGADGEQVARHLRRPVEPESEAEPTVRVAVGQPFGVFDGAASDGRGEAFEAIRPDPDGDLDAGSITLVGRARLRPCGGEIERFRALEPFVERDRASDTRHAVRSDLAVRRRDDVPDAGLQDEAQRFDRAVDPAVAALLFDPYPLRLPDRFCERREVRNGLARLEPAGCVEVEPLDESRRAGTELRREGGHDLEARGRDHGPKPQLRGRAGQARQEQRLRLLAGHPRQPRPVPLDESHAAVRSAIRVDGDAGLAQRLDITVHRPNRHLELARQLRSGHSTARLEQQEQVDETAGAHVGPSVRGIMTVRVMKACDDAVRVSRSR